MNENIEQKIDNSLKKLRICEIKEDVPWQKFEEHIYFYRLDDPDGKSLFVALDYDPNIKKVIRDGKTVYSIQPRITLVAYSGDPYYLGSKIAGIYLAENFRKDGFRLPHMSSGDPVLFPEKLVIDGKEWKFQQPDYSETFYFREGNSPGSTQDVNI